MKTIIAGSRDVSNYKYIELAMQKINWKVTEVVSGMAKGVDTYGLRWAHENQLPVMKFPADWNTHGKSAGPIRNGKMAEYADALVAIWDGKSLGTKNMIRQARDRGLKVAVFLIDELQSDLDKEEQLQHIETVKDLSDKPNAIDWKNVKLFVYDNPEHNHAAINFAVRAIKEIDRLNERVQKLEETIHHLLSKR